jgi:AcrR family transcriptional regulator
MRLIADKAGVAQALLHYHFQNKATLHAAVFERRASTINDAREKYLDELFAAKSHPTLEDVLNILFLPPAIFGEDHRGDYSSFQQMVTSVSVGSDDRSKELMIRYYDAIARRFISAFQIVAPGLTERTAIWSYLFALGARMQAQSKSDRAERLASKKSNGQPEPVSPLLTAFVAAGIRGVANAPLPSDGQAAAKTARRSKAISPG